MNRAISSLLKTAILLAFVLGTIASSAQHRVPHYPTPPQPSVPITAEPVPQQKAPQPKMNVVEMERESKELSQLAATIPGDVDLLKKGLFPKDVVEKLKRIEKLSKHLRGQVAP